MLKTLLCLTVYDIGIKIYLDGLNVYENVSQVI